MSLFYGKQVRSFEKSHYSARSFADASINLAAGKVYQQGWLKTASPNPLSGNPRIHTLSQFENVRGASGGQHDPGR